MKNFILIEPDAQDCDLRITDSANITNYRRRKEGDTYWYDFEHKIIIHY